MEVKTFAVAMKCQFWYVRSRRYNVTCSFSRHRSVNESEKCDFIWNQVNKKISYSANKDPTLSLLYAHCTEAQIALYQQEEVHTYLPVYLPTKQLTDRPTDRRINWGLRTVLVASRRSFTVAGCCLEVIKVSISFSQKRTTKQQTNTKTNNNGLN
jgi:hypothetical protein